MARLIEHVSGRDGEIGAFARVEADDYFVSVITDEYEGHAHFHVSVIPKLIEALAKAQKHVERQGRTRA